jgi:hypothetical protein
VATSSCATYKPPSARSRNAMHILFMISSINIWPGAEASCISTFVRGPSTMHIPFGISSINTWPEAAEKRSAATRRQPHKTKACNAAGVGRGKCKAMNIYYTCYTSHHGAPRLRHFNGTLGKAPGLPGNPKTLGIFGAPAVSTPKSNNLSFDLSSPFYASPLYGYRIQTRRAKYCRTARNAYRPSSQATCRRQANARNFTLKLG